MGLSPRPRQQRRELWSLSYTKDELTFQLSSANQFTIDKNNSHIHITHKYYDRAEFVL